MKALLWSTSDGSWWSNCCQDVCPLMGRHMPSLHSASKGMVTVILWRCQLAIVIQRFLNHQSVGYCMWCKPKSYHRGYMPFCIPWILEVFTNDLYAGTTNGCICCLHQLSIHVGICFICRPWFSWGFIGCEILPSYL